MRFIIKILKILIVLLILGLIASWWYSKNQQPNYDGELSLEHLSEETTVYFDDYGIPHIYAQNQIDALTTLGYVHAQDRLWQMELLRRIAPGRLSEIFGEKLLKNDKLFASLGIEEASLKSIQQLDTKSEAYLLIEAYLNGINQYIEEGKTPIEYTLVGLDKEPFTIKDVYNVMGYMSFSFAMAHKTDPLLSAIKEKLGLNYLKELNIDIDTSVTFIKTTQNKSTNFTAVAASLHNLLSNSPIPAFEGSNSWVIGPKKTASGSVIFTNDPHIGFSQPAVWYEAHIVTPNYEMYGYHLAGIPFPLLGHNRNYAYGLTMFENDDIDFYKEENHPSDKNKYKTANGYADYKIIHKTIKVKDAEDVQLTIRNTHHGPILNDVVDGLSENSPLAMFWAYTQLDNHVIDAFYKISRATTMEDVKKGASLIHAPGLNIMYGDAKGNIAWWASAKLYTLKSKANRKLILNETLEKDSISYLDFSQNPMAENPNWNYVYSANNQPDSIAGMLYPGYYVPEDRAKRIVNLLEAKSNWTKKESGYMINDDTSPVSPGIIKQFTSIMDFNSFSKNEQRAIDVLQLWDGSNTIDEVAPTIYNMWIYTYLKNTFQDELGEDLFKQFMTTHLSKRMVANQINKTQSIWWDNVTTTNKIETKKEILTKSLKEAVVTLENQFGTSMVHWTWGKAHTLEHLHPLGTVNLLNKVFKFNVGPFPINGASKVINNLSYDFSDTGVYTVKSGPSTRRIIDFSNIENSMSILPTGQSGNPFSIHYRDQAELYNEGKFRKMKLNKEEIIKTSTKLVFLPKK